MVVAQLIEWLLLLPYICIVTIREAVDAIVTIQEAVDAIVTIQEAGPWLWLLDVS